MRTAKSCGRKRYRCRQSAVNTLAAAFDHAITVFLLAVALDLPARGATGDGTGDGGQLLAVAAAHLVAEQATNHRAGGRTGNTVGVTRIALHFHVLADHAAAIVEFASFITRPVGLRACNRAGR
ncbi:hypothetical protein G6F32_016926 [Rhizopus arrhizus]|uniref:Uncharacterized protein n=1 Tax=Rhizopus delemar TaxID=936053 RepID=A0A9P6XPF3_9FUNG|nr:hypothetical protein G6F32_016926 [Rhizopus arrhizus]KAG1529843.1 hypothetical protein G6F50_017722 [Rhizopus delemar]